MSTEELVSGVLEGLKLNALDLSALFRTALLILAGVVVIRVLLRIVDRMLSRSQNLGSVGGYIRSVVRIALWFLLVLVVADSLGIPVASMIALLSVAGLAISLALQNTLSNLAGGIMILVSKPFEVGDYVEADGVSGTVHAIDLSYTAILTIDGKEIFVPNSQLSDHLADPGFHDHHDHFTNSSPESEWRTCLEHAEKIGLGSRKYELIRV